MPASFAAAASPSMFAPFSVGCRTLMIDANPIFLISGTAAALAFRAAEDGADDRAAHGAAADLRGAAVSGRVAFTEDRFGVHRDARAIGEHERVEADAESRALLELAAALDERHRADRARA